MAKSNNLNVNFTGNASGIKKAASEAADAVAGAFGVSSRQLKQFSDGIKGLIRELGKVGDEGNKGIKGLELAFKALGSTVAGLGLTALTVAFKKLSDDAARFRNTVEGIDMTNVGKAFRDTFAQSLSDQNGFGEGFARLMDKVKTGASKAFATGANFIMLNKGDVEEANRLATRAAEIAEELNRIRAEERDTAIQIARYNVTIAEAQERARDVSLSMEERQKALSTLQGTISQKYALQLDIQQRKLELIKEQNSLTQSSEADVVAENQLAMQLIELNARKSQEMRSTLEIQNQFVRLQEKELELAQQIAEARQSMAASPIAALGAISGGGASGGDGGGLAMGGLTEMWDSVSAAQTSAIEKQQALNEQIGEFLTELKADAVYGFAESIGALAGNLTNGSGAWRTFANSAMTGLADMAISVGKIAIATGVGAEGIKVALESLNPVAAIAAGTALVALGVWAKTSLSNVASGSSAASSSVASSNYGSRQSLSTNSSLLETMTIKVTGKLQAEGSKLVAVLNNENNRLSYVGA